MINDIDFKIDIEDSAAEDWYEQTRLWLRVLTIQQIGIVIIIIIIISIVEQKHVWFTMKPTQSEEILKNVRSWP